ncbi:hypothetical protein V5P93_005265 [Actinokineospora auranticolor]|uniref:Ribosomally synthesized peptide with SipW-like signal peptide n=1 Tax=Actinokineospora auranticolor TaxID=155976 RepID=A0A2S6GDC4_9PSEU|nr:hypothetical protein [Actinokineospora auranticolor]PPK63121.1 hypothetical protein CLV40_13254 [Actinokineospora auranticolor]
MRTTAVRRLRRATVLAAAVASLSSAVVVPAAASAVPNLAVTYEVTASAVGKARNLVFVITNPYNVAASWKFNLPLPTGLDFAGVFTFSENCMSANAADEPPLFIPPRSGVDVPTVYVEGSSYVGEAICVVSVPVTAVAEGTYSTCSANVQGLTNLTANFLCQTIRFEAQHPHFAAE